MPRTRPSQFSTASTPRKVSLNKIPLNDDRQEKAHRLQNRQALHEQQLKQLKQAATPKKGSRLSLGGSPSVADNDSDLMISVSGSAVKPMKNAPIMADFEEWIKLATDNKINAANSWNFALIDYFHDMSLLKEGESVNFQRASCTLDGCVKIYTNRVDSVATDTGKLLSGLADSGNKKQRGDAEGDVEGEDDDEDEEGEDGTKRKKKRTQRHAEATLVSSFAQLQLKKMELEFSVDPLFKKASADFDEGGAKGLLLNHLAIDGEGRIVFDSSDDAQDATAEDNRAISPTPGPEEDETVVPTVAEDIDIAALGAKYFPDLAKLDEQDICPSLKNFDLGDPAGTTDLPFLKAPEDWRQDRDKTGLTDDEGVGERSGVFLDSDNALGFDDDDDMNLGGFDIPLETDFGEGGDAWAREAALDQQVRVHTMPMGDGEDGDGGAVDGATFGTDQQYSVSIQRGEDHENILSYFDNDRAFQKNWAGPEHWKIRRIKDLAKADGHTPTKRKEKEPFEIDFAAPMSQALADSLYNEATSASAISLPKAQWKSKTRNLLPDDKHFNSRQLLRLFLKPKARMGARRAGKQVDNTTSEDLPQGEVDENYWARKEKEGEDEAPQGNYDADFFQDDGLPMPGGILDEDDDDFADAREHFSPPAEGGAETGMPMSDALSSDQDGAFGAQLIAQNRRARPEYVQYARVAKKVDVRRLKEEMWRNIGFEETLGQSTSRKPLSQGPDDTLHFTDVMNSLRSVYPKNQLDDISTSYGFICLLHLANEKGLVITNEPEFTNLAIRRDHSADLTAGGD